VRANLGYIIRGQGNITGQGMAVYLRAKRNTSEIRQPRCLVGTSDKLLSTASNDKVSTVTTVASLESVADSAPA
jgi:hypothetical protein